MCHRVDRARRNPGSSEGAFPGIVSRPQGLQAASRRAWNKGGLGVGVKALGAGAFFAL